jgi:pimeloyl-ACP methyl ester carboxylesterase
VTIREAGHWVHSQEPEKFVEVVRGFLQHTQG